MAPDAVKVAVFVGQMVADVAVTSGKGFTVMVDVPEVGQPLTSVALMV